MKELKQSHYHFVDKAQDTASRTDGSSPATMRSDNGIRAWINADNGVGRAKIVNPFMMLA